MNSILIKGLASEYEFGSLIPAHVHDAHQIVHAVSGVMRIQVVDGTWVVPPGRGLWVPAHVQHQISCISAVSMRTVYLQGDHSVFPRHVRVTPVSALMREMMVRIAQGAEPHQIPHYLALIIDEIKSFDDEPLRLPQAHDKRIHRLVKTLHADPANTRTLEDWASDLGMSPRSLIRHIGKETRLTFRELRRLARVLAALEQLALGNSVTRVALDVGFNSPSAFIHSFRTVTGRTPRQYMQ